MLEHEKKYKNAFCYKDHAKIDLNTLMISINSFSNEPHTEFFDAINEGDTSGFFTNVSQDFDSFKKYAELESIILHEKTHYLDMTSTSYGLEYFIRKHNYHLVCDNKENSRYNNARETFAVSLYELQPLESLKEILFDNWSQVENYKFQLDSHEKFGVYLKFLINSNTGKTNTFPLSMLMILETRAFCIEYLSLFEKSKYLEGVNKSIYEQSIKRKFDEELNDCSMSEYNFLLKLAILEFERINIDFKNTMKFISYLLGWTLNISFMRLTSMSSHIVKFFQPSPYRDSLQMDISRGMSRYIIPFIIFQSIPNYIINNLPDSQLLKEFLENTPKEAINFILKRFLDISNEYSDIDEILDNKLTLIKIIEETSPEDFIIEIIRKGYLNGIKYESNDFNLNFSDYYFQADIRNVDDTDWGEWIKYPKLCSINYEENFLATDRNYERISRDTELYENYERVHMPISLAVQTLDNLVWNPMARYDYIFK